jgi:aryl-alcohol dehydrogenase-like predicted oxidoreductase
LKTINYLDKIGIGSSGYGSRVNSLKSEKIIKELFSYGINYIDTSPLYGAGEAEKIIGKIYQDRKKVILATKFGLSFKKKNKIIQLLIPIVRLIYNFPIINQILKNRKHSHDENPLSLIEIEKSVERSLKHLNTNYLDILFIHNNIYFYLNDTEVLNYLINLKKKKIINKLGITTSLKDQKIYNLIKLHNDLIDIIQIPLSNYNYFSDLKVEINCFSAFSNGEINKEKIHNFLDNSKGRLIIFFKTKKNIQKNLNFFNINKQQL